MDEFQCHKWAKQQSGSDPTAYDEPGSPSARAPGIKRGAGIVRGGARGALLGAVGGAIGGDAGKGAKIGAGVGATARAFKTPSEQNRTRCSDNRLQSQVQQQSQAATGGYDKAYRVCLKGRGYEVE